MELLAEYKMKITKLIKTKAELINAQNLFDLGKNYFISNIYMIYILNWVRAVCYQSYD